MWRESLNIDTRDIPNGLHIEQYGDACGEHRPTITGSDPFDGGWVKAGRIWSRNLPSGTPKIEALTVGSVALHTARWPDATAVRDHALTSATQAPKPGPTVGIRSDYLAMLLTRDITGAVIQLRTADWRIERHIVQSVDAVKGTMLLQENSAYTVAPGADFILFDKLWMLDAPGEFYHDVEHQRLFLILHDGAITDPNQTSVEGCVRDDGLVVAAQSGLVVQGLAIENFRHAGMILRSPAQTQINDVLLRNNLVKGVRAYGRPPARSIADIPNLTIQDSSIVGSALFGVDAAEYSGLAILRNQVTGVGMGPGNDMGNSYAAISTGPGSSVHANHIRGAAYLGIRFDGSGGSRITDNHIDGYCARIGDCAAIYTWNGPKGQQKREDQSALVQGNIVLDTAVRAQKVQTRAGWMTSGIYLDDFSRGVVVRDNTIGYAPIGIHVHNGSDHLIESNKVWLSSQTTIWANMDQTDADYMQGNRYRNNELVSFASVNAVWPAAPIPGGAQLVWYWHKSADLTRLSRTYDQEFLDNRMVQIGAQPDSAIRLRGPGFDTVSSPQMANQQKGGMPSVKLLPAPVAPFIASLGPELIMNGNFSLGRKDWGFWFNPRATGGQANFLVGGETCKDGCMKFRNASTDDLVHSAGFQLVPGMSYLLAFDAEFAEGGKLAAPYISRNQAPWDRLIVPGSQSHLSSLLAQPGQRLHYRGVFQFNQEREPARLNVKLASVGNPVVLDNISLRQVVSYTTSPVVSTMAIANVYRDGAFVELTCKALKWSTDCAATNVHGEVVPMGASGVRKHPELLLRTR